MAKYSSADVCAAGAASNARPAAGAGSYIRAVRWARERFSTLSFKLAIVWVILAIKASLLFWLSAAEARLRASSRIMASLTTAEASNLSSSSRIFSSSFSKDCWYFSCLETEEEGVFLRGSGREKEKSAEATSWLNFSKKRVISVCPSPRLFSAVMNTPP